MKRSHKKWHGPLARRLGTSVFLISIIVTALTSTLYLYTELRSDLKNIDIQLDGIENIYLPSIGSRLWVADIDALKLDLTGMLNLNSIEYIAITEQGKMLLEAGTHPSSEPITHHYPIFYLHDGIRQKIGNLTIEASTADVYQTFYDNALSSIIIVALQTFIVAGLVLLLVSRCVTRHLVTISAFARQLGLSNLEQQLVLNRPQKAAKDMDELDVLVQALSDMQKQLGQSVVALSASEENLALTLNCIGDAVIATDAKGVVTRMNPVAETLTAWTASEAIGRSIRDVFPIINATTHEPVENPVQQALATGKIVTLSNHTTLVAKNSAEYQIADSAAPIRNGDTIIGAILVFHDVTEQYRIRQELADSQKHLKLHIDQTPLAVIEWDGNFSVRDWNPAAEKIFGYCKEEAMGRHATELIVPSSVRPEVNAVWQRLLSNQTVVHQINENTTKTGKTLTCEWFNTPLVDENNRVVGVASFVDDISLRVATEEITRQQQQEQQQLIDNLLDAVLTIDETGTILSLNVSAEKLFGYSAKEILGQHFRLIMPPEIVLEYETYLQQSAQGITVDIIDQPHEIALMNKAGNQFPTRLSVTIFPRPSTNKHLFVASVHDLSNEKKTEEQLRRSQKMDALGKLTGGIAHDYNNMLAIVLGYAELLHQSLLDKPKLLAYTDQITQAGERGATLTKKLLAFSKQRPFEAASLDLNTLLTDQQHLLEKVVTARITVKMELLPELWSVRVDKGDFEDVLMNLCINAMHAMDTINATNNIFSIETFNQRLNAIDAKSLGIPPGDYAELCISDTGKGMDKSTQSKMFDPFFTTKGELGTGLGLSQVYGFMERSKGGIHVYSKPGIGTRFCLYFPRDTHTSQENNAAPVTDISLLDGNETIIVVDDEPSLLEIAKDLLTHHGYNVMCANSGDEALTLLRNNPIDLVISDVIMPHMNGYELASTIKIEFPLIKILIVSGFNETNHVEKSNLKLELKTLSKPYSSQSLLERVRQLLDQGSQEIIKCDLSDN